MSCSFNKNNATTLKTGAQTIFSCNNFDCIKKNNNSQIITEGFFRKYTPNKVGKGATKMLWDWELVLSDNTTIPVVDKNKSADLSIYQDQNVSIYGNVFYGVIIDEVPSIIENRAQTAKGYRIDAISFQTKHTKK